MPWEVRHFRTKNRQISGALGSKMALQKVVPGSTWPVVRWDLARQKTTSFKKAGPLPERLGRSLKAHFQPEVRRFRTGYQAHLGPKVASQGALNKLFEKVPQDTRRRKCRGEVSALISGGTFFEKVPSRYQAPKVPARGIRVDIWRHVFEKSALKIPGAESAGRWRAR